MKAKNEIKKELPPTGAVKVGGRMSWRNPQGQSILVFVQWLELVYVPDEEKPVVAFTGFVAANPAETLRQKPLGSMFTFVGNNGGHAAVVKLFAPKPRAHPLTPSIQDVSRKCLMTAT